ncbi:MAG: 2-oxoglutarate dehydrogenase E1 component [Flavobacteriales bacterium]|jgi:2-oxoglutarate dehydrogenase E1 component|nr:2-oxoglutarate dehydrogenase E1 component [Flavobacteriales bacterium]
MDKFSFLGSIHGAFVEDIYQQYLEDPDSVMPTWRSFFQGYHFAHESYSGDEIPEGFHKEFKVINLINGYRERGHLFTETNPVRQRRAYSPSLDIQNFGLSAEDLDQEFQAGSEIGIGSASLREIIIHLEEVYCSHIGIEFMHIHNVEEVQWIKNRIHQNDNKTIFAPEQKKHMLKKLNEAVAFESFLHTKYVGQKRFSLEGGETAIPAIDAAVEHGADFGIKEFVFGMAHRGRLNVLANIFRKSYSDVFKEFEGKGYIDEEFDGDVKYHLGYTREMATDRGKEVKMSLCPNPSHLETVDAVVGGIAKAKIDHEYGKDANAVMPILIHGDAAIAGQGIVYEVVQMAQLEPYHVGGTLHLVINNQIGFTTNYLDARSSIYCTDIAKTTMCPVFHINGDDVEAVVHAMEIAIEYRQKFNKDVFIDLLCYRKYGHNEGDEPRFTQPNLYKLISKHPNPREIYNEKLMGQGVVEKQIVKEMEKEFKTLLSQDLDEAKSAETQDITPFLEEEWKEMRRGKFSDFHESPKTGIALETLKEVAQKIYTLPEDANVYKKAVRLMGDRQKMVEETNKLDWGMAELLAYGTLLHEGESVRLTGQDVERGTFSHRHAVLRTENSERRVRILEKLQNNSQVCIHNSLLSEYGVLGFEYGYAMARPHTLTIWEAQFGDFSNGAQILIDQYLSAAEDKWKIQNGLVMLLPHGYEGQGAEHSSARMERYLQLCAQLNMQVANPTTPAQMFHLLRRQQYRRFRKPLIVFTPKSLLRHPQCISTLEDLSTGKFHEIIDDNQVHPSQVNKVVFCSGKIYYELLAKKVELGREDVALIRLEQLYPLPIRAINKIITRYSKANTLIWAQEEPENMGAWTHILRHLRHFPFEVIARSSSATPASGSSKRAKRRQEEIIDNVFDFKTRF